MNSTFVIANHFIKHFNGNINLMKLQVLIYYAQGWHLIIEKAPLLDEKIRLDKYGIRIDSIYFSLVRNYGNKELILQNNYNIIQMKDLVYNIDSNYELNLGEPDLFRIHPDKNYLSQKTIEFLDEIIKGYGKLSSTKLMNMIHLEPHVFSKYNGVYENLDQTYISNEELTESFLKLDQIYNEENDS